MSFLTWLKQSPFATPWFDAILFGVLLFEILPFFIRHAAARFGFTAASVSCQLGLLFSCLFLSATLTETLAVLSLAAIFSALSSYIEYRLFDRNQTIEECRVKAAEAERIAVERAKLFVLPISDEKTVEPAQTEKPPVSEPDGKGDNEQ